MTIELNLPPELENLARSNAQEQFQGDMNAYLLSVLREHLVPYEHDAKVEQKLLEALDSPTKPLTDALWEEMRQRASVSKA